MDNFKDLSISSTYYNSENQILKEFLIPLLKITKVYKRETYSFSSSIYSLINDALVEIIKNKCKIKYIVGIEINQNDLNAIEKGLKDDKQVIRNHIEKEFGSVEEFIKGLSKYGKNVYEHRLNALSYLVSEGILEIKIGFVSKNKRIRDPDKFKFHPKVMIFEDFEGNKIVTNGSTNESLGALTNNQETFDVYKGWNKHTREYFDRHYSLFDEFWNNKAKNIKTIPINDIIENSVLKKYKGHFKSRGEILEVENKLNDIYKKHISELDDVSEENKNKINKETVEDNLYDFQKEGIKEWESNSYKGILKMATGTGKTFTALAAMGRVLKIKDNTLVAITVPKTLLASQWIEKLSEFGYENIVKVMGSKSTWTKDLRGAILKKDLGRAKEVICVGTYDSICKKDFLDIIEDQHKGDKMLIADEMHYSWAPEYKKGMVDLYDKKLGLSATPERYMDEKGTEEMQNYFGGIVFSFGIDKAIPKFLTEYEYKAEFAKLEDEEREQYDDLSRTISRSIAANRGEIDDKIFRLILKRSKIIVNSESKWEYFNKILDKLGKDLDSTLIYCSDKQIARVKEILHSRKIIAHEITFRQPLEHRERIIDLFKSKKYQVVVAMKILDEGIDVPSIKRAIILASSGNPIEFVQRRGRILRKFEGKDFSEIYDIIVFPWEKIPEFIDNADRSILRRELNRIEEFAKNSLNPLEIMNKMARFKSLLVGTY
jgi:superfamily II DNA or RNA helicase